MSSVIFQECINVRSCSNSYDATVVTLQSFPNGVVLSREVLVPWVGSTVCAHCGTEHGSCVCFASVSPVPSICLSWSPTALSVRIIPVCVEGLGMATCLVSPGQVLLTGGSSRGGRGAATRILLRGQEGWRSVSVELSGDLGEKVCFLWCFVSCLVEYFLLFILKHLCRTLSDCQ